MSAAAIDSAPPSIVGDNDYVPAMRWKAGEMRAINQLIRDGQATNIVPLFLIDNDKERQQNEKGRVPTTPTSYIDYIAAEMQKTVGTTRVAFVDTHLFDSKQQEDGLVLFFGTLLAGLTKLIPVVRLSDKAGRRASIQSIAMMQCTRPRLARLHGSSRFELLPPTLFGMISLPRPEAGLRVPKICRKIGRHA